MNSKKRLAAHTKRNTPCKPEMSVRVRLAQTQTDTEYHVFLTMQMPDGKPDTVVYCGTGTKEHAGLALVAAWCAALGQPEDAPDFSLRHERIGQNEFVAVVPGLHAYWTGSAVEVAIRTPVSLEREVLREAADVREAAGTLNQIWTELGALLGYSSNHAAPALVS